MDRRAAARDAERAASATCVVCLQGSTAGALDQCFKGAVAHVACYNAVRAFDRLLKERGDPEARRLSDREFVNDREAWRAKVQLMVAQPGQKRSAAQRMAARAALDESFRTVESVKTTWRLPLQRYIAYRTFWDRIPADLAEQKFYEQLQQQDSEHEDSEG